MTSIDSHISMLVSHLVRLFLRRIRRCDSVGGHVSPGMRSEGSKVNITLSVSVSVSLTLSVSFLLCFSYPASYSYLKIKYKLSTIAPALCLPAVIIPAVIVMCLNSQKLWAKWNICPLNVALVIVRKLRHKC